MRSSILKAFAILAIVIFVASHTPAQREQLELQQTGLKRLPRGITVSKLKTHVMAPTHTKGIEMEEVDEAREFTFKVATPTKEFKAKPRLKVEAFAAAVHTVMQGRAAGYIMQVRQNGNPIYTNVWEWAQTPSNLRLPWTENTRMHVASVSKLLTAIGMVKLLDSKGISYDAKIIDYLPTYWVKGPNVDKITFRHLLTHTSGIGGDKTPSDYLYMQMNLMLGVATPGSDSSYKNMNFGLMRILIPIINGDISKNHSWPSVMPRNESWDAFTIGAYKEYMQDKVFSPAGVTNADFAPLPTVPNSALAYGFPAGNGWNSGNLETMAGGAAWRLSLKELLDVMNHFRRKNTIIDSQKAQYMLDNKLGIDQVKETPAGKIYNKNGKWGNNGRDEQSVAYFFPDGMEVAVFVNSPIINSPIAPEKISLRNTIRDAFLASLTE